MNMEFRRGHWHQMSVDRELVRVRKLVGPALRETFERYCPGRLVSETLASALPSLVARLVREKRVHAVLAETYNVQRSVWSAHSVGLFAFLTRPALDRMQAEDSAFLGVELLAAAGHGRSATWFLDERQVAAQNAGDGVDAFILKWFNCDSHDFDILSDQGRICLESAYRALSMALAGHNLASVRMQGGAWLAPAYAAAGFRIEKSYPAGSPARCPDARLTKDRVTYAYTRDDFRQALHGSPVSRLFYRRRPRLGLTAAEREVLELALEGLTNEQIADRLDVGVSAIKDRWDRIYVRFEARIPQMLDCADSLTNARGGERRRSVLRHIENHPEELRPYAVGSA